MHPSLELYKGLKERIRIKIPEFRTIELFNDQFRYEGKEKAFGYPACFIDFENSEWGSTTGRTQKGNITFTLHIGVQSLKNMSEKPFELMEKTYQHLQGVCGINRVSEVHDTEHDNVIVYQQSFVINIIDDNAINPDNYKATTISTLNLTYDLDIDNSQIRTGDGTV